MIDCKNCNIPMEVIRIDQSRGKAETVYQCPQCNRTRKILSIKLVKR